jgi:hypothetical protein
MRPIKPEDWPIGNTRTNSDPDHLTILGTRNRLLFLNEYSTEVPRNSDDPSLVSVSYSVGT